MNGFSLALSVHDCFLLLRNRNKGPSLTGSNSAGEHALLVPAGSIVQITLWPLNTLVMGEIKGYHLLSPVGDPGRGLNNNQKKKKKKTHTTAHTAPLSLHGHFTLPDTNWLPQSLL